MGLLMDKSISDLLVQYYKNADNEMIVPHSLLSKLINLLIEKGVKRITQISFFENAFNDSAVFEVLKSHSSACKIQRIYAVQYLKQIRNNKCNFLIARDAKSGIDSFTFALSKAQAEKLSPFFEFILFDDNIAVINKSIFVSESVLTENADILKDCQKWIETANSQRKIVYADDFLQEPIMQSADMMYEVASLCCTHNHVNQDSCYWYHSIWQYLRLLDVVSTPSWHHDFYTKYLFDNVEYGKNASALISGAADYSMLAYVLHTAKRKSLNTKVTVIDLCETPLFACKWYAKNMNHPLTAMQVNIFDVPEDKPFDMICADAFLTRFSGDKLRNVLSKWNRLLNPGGIVVTTVRIHDEKHVCPPTPSEETVQRFKKKALSRMEIWERHINLTADEIGEKVENYAKKMVSNYLGTKESLLTAIEECGFNIDFIDDVEVSGELYPSRYLRLLLGK